MTPEEHQRWSEAYGAALASGEPDEGMVLRLAAEQTLLNRIAEPGMICGPGVIDNRAWYQHLPGLNPYAELEERARQAEREWSAEAEAG